MGEHHWLLGRQDPRNAAPVRAVITISAAVFAATSAHPRDAFTAVFAATVALLGVVQVVFSCAPSVGTAERR